MPLSEPAERVWAKSEEYIIIAMEHLAQHAPLKIEPHNGAEFPVDSEFMRVAFLFPDLPRSTRDSLMALRTMRWAVLGSHQKEEAGGALAGATSAQAEQNEAIFADMVKKAAIQLESFTPVQQEILREKYLSAVGAASR